MIGLEFQYVREISVTRGATPGFTGYDAVQNRFSGQVGVNFETLEAMGHSWSRPAPVTVRPSKDLSLNLLHFGPSEYAYGIKRIIGLILFGR